MYAILDLRVAILAFKRKGRRDEWSFASFHEENLDRKRKEKERKRKERKGKKNQRNRKQKKKYSEQPRRGVLQQGEREREVLQLL